MATTKCPKCGKPTAKQDKRKKDKRLVPQNGSTVEEWPGRATRIRCGGCQTLNFLVTGRMS